MTDSPTSYVFDVEEAGFQTQVLDRSREVPVVVDFWAAWCGPCRTLGPLLERAVDARGGEVVLAKVDVDRNQGLAQAFRVQGIPQVIGFRDGRPVAQFTGVIPEPQLASWLDELAPSEADRLVADAAALPPVDAEAALRRALELDPSHRAAAIALAERTLDTDPEAALALITPHRPDPAAEAVATRIELARSGGGDLDALRAAAAGGDGQARYDLGLALAAHGDHAPAIEELLAAVVGGGDAREPAREKLVALFGLLGDDHELVRAARPRLARALF